MLTAAHGTKFEKKIAPFIPWIVCLCSSLFFFYEFIQGNMFASIADNIMQDFHIEANKMSYLSSVYYISNVLFLFFSGLILDKYSPKKTILLAMLLCVISTFVLAKAHSFYIALFCRFITGMGSAFCFLGPVRIASQWFPPKRMAMITGIIVTVAMTGGMLAQYPLTKLVSLIGWRNALMDIGYLGVVILLLITLGVIDKPPLAKLIDLQPIRGLAKKIYFNPQILCAAFYTSLMNMSVAVYGAMMGSLYLIQRLGISKEEAASVNTMLFLGAIIGGPLIGWWSDRGGLRIFPMKLGAIVSLITVMIILFIPVSLATMKLLFLVLGFFTAAQVISYALVAENSSPYATATAISMISIITQGGYVIYQNIFSLLLIVHGGVRIINGTPIYSLSDYQFAGLIFPLGLLFAFFMVLGLKETHCQSIGEKTC